MSETDTPIDSDSTDSTDPDLTEVHPRPQNLTPATPPAHPRRIGSFEVLRLLGEGGMGAVYLAEQKKPVARQVALKVIHASLRTPRALARFDAERNALARLSHPNVAVLHEAGTTEDGFPYFAMEHVEDAEAITAYCDRHRLPIERRLELFIEVCEGVQHAHQKGILHRDLKPSNVLVTTEDGVARVKVIDFSLAKSLDASPLSDQTQLTRGLALGTPAYMSPEAWDGSADLDTRSDVFSLGVMLYELLVGARPDLKSDTGTGLQSSELVGGEVALPSLKARRASGEVLTARRITSQELDRRLVGDLDWILRCALARDRDERYPSVSELLGDIERHLRDEPVSVGPPSWRYRARKFYRRHRTGVIASAGLLLLLLGAAGILGQMRQEAEERTRLAAELNRQVERIEWLQRVMDQLPLGVEGDEGPVIERAMARIRVLERGDAGLAAYALGRGALALDDPVTARSHFEAALHEGYRAPEVKLALGWTLAELYDRRLDALRRASFAEEREAQLERADRELRLPALELLEQSADGSWIVPELLAARVALQQRDAERAIELGRQVAERSGWLYEARFIVARALLLQAERARDEDKDLDRGLALYRAALEEVDRGLTIGRSDPDGHRLRCVMLGTQLQTLVRYSRPGIDEVHRRTVEACRQAQRLGRGELEPLLVEAEAEIGLAEVQLWDRGEDPRPAIGRVEELLGGALESGAHPGRQIAELASALGRAAVTESLYTARIGEDPRPVYQRAIDRFEHALEAEPAAWTYSRLAAVLAEQASWKQYRGIDAGADHERALEAATKAAELQPEIFEAHHALGRAQVSLALHKLGRGTLTEADLARAETAFRRALEIEPSSLIVHSALAVVKTQHAALKRKRGEDSAVLLEEALALLDEGMARNPDPTYLHFLKGRAFTGLAWNALEHGADPTAATASARQQTEQGLERLPRVPGPWIGLAEAHLIDARWALARGLSTASAVDAAIRNARLGLERDARRADAPLHLGLAFLIRALDTEGAAARRAIEDARRELERAIEMAPSAAENRVAFARLAWVAVRDTLVDDPEALRRRGLGHAAEAERLDPSNAEATLLRGALLTLDPATRAEGEALIAAARERNPRLILDWEGE